MPPKRKSAASSNASPRKRRRADTTDSDSDDGEVHQFGAATKDDERDARAFSTAATTATRATRSLPFTGPCPPLSSFAIRVAAGAISKLYTGKRAERTKTQLLRVPDHVVPRLFAQLRALHPTLLNNTIISTYFLRGNEVVLTGDLPGVSAATIAAIPRLGSPATLHTLELSGLQAKTLSDDAAAKVLKQLPALEKLVLRDSKGVGHLAVTSAAKHCQRLRFVNLNYTQATADSVTLLISSCPHLTTLKLAAVLPLNKSGLKPLLALAKHAVTNTQLVAGQNIVNLKLRSLTITPEPAYRALLSFFPNLRRLDLSHTNVHFNDALVGDVPPALEKLAINHTPTTGAELCEVLGRFTHLRTLNIAALGAGKGTPGMHSTTMFALTPQVLRVVTNTLAGFENLENLSLAASARLTAHEVVYEDQLSAFQDFLARVGRRCKFLDLSNISDLKSRDLSTLVGDEDAPPPALEHLLLSGCTKIDDDAAVFIASCVNLRVLELESTSIRSEGVFQILDRCQKLESIDLTGCRGVRIHDRRRIFEAWEADRGAGSG
ncbi:RNI-like protein [Exidia glandulosa HHB12029]|uniref:RNI-like protein n=1 Tax=Exidia glandulosa HHB12029 TaxID=1314781 RepID=A0A165MC98_EXIGL|nr:RNI-like protein [Exidia glandulosa HHB12029]